MNRKICFRDYTYHEYYPNTSDCLGKIDNETFFSEVLDAIGINNDYRINIMALKDRIQSKIGVNKIIWGIKKFGNKYKVEFYLYNYNKKDRLISVKDFKKYLSPDIKFLVTPEERLNYFMFSFEIDEAAFRKGKIINCDIYISDKIHEIGYAFKLEGDKLQLKNSYKFYPPDQKYSLVKLIRSSFPSIDCSKIFLPITARKSICLATKNILTNNMAHSIYFNLIDIDDLIRFMKIFRYSKRLIKFLEEHKNQLDHFLYDVGFDFYSKRARTDYIKSGFYGLL